MKRRQFMLAGAPLIAFSISCKADGKEVTPFSELKKDSKELFRSNYSLDFINIKNYGAVGDGITDDTTAWKAWQRKLKNGGIGYIPAGNYVVLGKRLSFDTGCIGNFNHFFKNRFPAIRTGENHLLASSRIISIVNSQQGLAIAPTISIDAILDVPDSATDVNNKGKLLSSCHGIYVQHKQTGGNKNNKLSSTAIVTSVENAAIGDNDCSGVAAKAKKADVPGGIGDCAGIGGRIDNYSTQPGGTMGAEFVVYNHANGIPRPSDYNWVSTNKWTTAVHIIANCSGAPATAALLMQGANNGAYDGIQISRSLFKMNANSNILINPTKNISADTQQVITVDSDGHLAGTTGIDMGSFSKKNGYPEHGIVIGYCDNHIFTPGQYMKVRALGLDVGSHSNVSIRANAKNAASTDTNPTYGTTGFNFCQTTLAGDTTTNATIFYNPETYSVALHNFASNFGIVAYKPNKSTSSNDVTYFMPGMCTDNNGNEVVSKIALGSGVRRWENIYAKTSTFSDSDERIKQDITDIPDAVMRAWGRINFKQFRFREAYNHKGKTARIHRCATSSRI